MISSGDLFVFTGISTMQARIPGLGYDRIWQRGYACPVQGCGLQSVRDVTDLKRHWREKHEEIIAKFHCSACSYVSKRKSNVFQHFRLRHNGNMLGNSSESVGKVEYQHNKQFIDPYPLTLESVLRYKD
ncbi:hypothetical protein PoB_004011000 [Plakobranchus ocellatus]|uniref:C2H2-type domain-containing protein n=1 Tax=Plakobranchus ocellatus TaxID=259542 RepID=A0AAV4B3E5_9GAST|nr:hypothetical protein PoB_004011000 [Plakobranchus ocellatus]